MKKITFPKFSFNFSLPGFKKQKLALGLDIGSYSVKVCELTSTPNGCRLLKLGSAKLPEGAVEDGVLQDPDSVGNIITTLISNLKIKSKKVAISISGYSVIVKKINLAVMTEEELAGHIQAEAEQYIPFDIDDVYLDFQDLKTNTEESDRTDIMLVAAKKDVVNTYLKMLESVGLQAVVVDVDAFALENSYENVEGLSENVALIDIGASKMSINIIANGASILARDVVMGSRQITEQIQSQLDMSAEDAEAAKVGLIELDQNQQGLVKEIFVNTCTQWILEIKKAIDFYLSSYPNDTIDRLILSGGGTKITGFDTLLSEETKIKVDIFDPFSKAESNADKIDPAYLEHVAPEMAIAAGLAIRKAEL
jgi:type IV pilus assembly protein PilM